MIKTHLSILLSCACLSLQAQHLDAYNLFQMQLRQNVNGIWTAETPKFLNTFNRGAYNNQPKFFSDAEIYLSAQMYGDTTQTDIVSLNLKTQVMSRVTATEATAEYSPTPMPDGERFSTVRVEEDGSQHLWSFPLDRSDYGRREIGNISGVGYHCWLRDTLLALFIVGENDLPHTLQIAGIQGQKTHQIAMNIGRCLLKTAEGELAFIHKVSPENWYLKTWDPEQGSYTIVEKMPGQTEDFCILPDGSYLCGLGSKLMLHEKNRSGWLEISDLSKYAVTNITRVEANSAGLLVLVVQ